MVQRLSVELLVMAGIGLILGLLGPFGTYAMPTALRLVYWIGFILVGYAIFRPITRVAGWLDDSTPIPFPAAIIMAVAVASLPLALLIGFAINGITMDGSMLGAGFALLYVQCAGIGIAIFLLMRVIFPDGDGSADPATADGQSHAKPDMNHFDGIPVKLLDRLPAGFPKKISALGVEDHYVRVLTPERTEMLLMRLGDAIAEMDGIEGMQVHRSWWVARSAIMTSKRDGRNLRLVLDCGLEVPVSRAYVAPLKQTGWI
ncbi:LytTR family DNA-binding domain-containing protein [Parasphingorhabdus sp.]|uniref:LytTR family DNA-binding domain-containing protein n=1 Tax=Parasphingorhabdus sp. TaxID=2709688 RepID=UPI0032645D40